MGVEIVEVWGGLVVERSGRGLASLVEAVVFGRVLAEQRVDLRWPTLAGLESETVIAVMLLKAKETPYDHRPCQFKDRDRGAGKRDNTAFHGYQGTYERSRGADDD